MSSREHKEHTTPHVSNLGGAAPHMKRFLDIVLGGALLIACVPAVIICVLVVRLIDGGPGFFVQPREGLGGRMFRMWKIRTMTVNADTYLKEWLRHHPDREEEWRGYGRLQNDPRLLPIVGAFLRRASIDEMPQLWNVVKGDMSLVGPRPLDAGSVAMVGPNVLEIRRCVRPGLTGLWQVSGRSDLDLLSMVRIDDEYVRSWSISLDLRILALTPKAVLTRRGAF